MNLNVAKLIIWGSDRGVDPAEIVMIKSDPGNTSGIFLYILDVFEEKNLFFENRGSRMRVGG